MQAVIRLYREARRRKVFRTAALYVLGAWAACRSRTCCFRGSGFPKRRSGADLGGGTGAAGGARLWLVVRDRPGRDPPHRTGDGRGGGASAAARPARLSDPGGLRRDRGRAHLPRRAGGSRDASGRGSCGRTGKRRRATARNSIAVLPFANISNDPDNEYFCDGISEEILDRLSRAAGLNVIGRTSSFAFKGSDCGHRADQRAARRALRAAGQRAQGGRSAAHLGAAARRGGVQVWSETFDRQLANVFEIQSEIAGAVATTVASQVVPRPASVMTRPRGLRALPRRPQAAAQARLVSCARGTAAGGRDRPAVRRGSCRARDRPGAR